MPEWLKGADCKSAAFRYVGSNPTRPIFNNNSVRKFNYSPTIVLRIRYKLRIKRIPKIIKPIRDFGFLNKFRKGVKITKIKPIKLLIKNRG